MQPLRQQRDAAVRVTIASRQESFACDQDQTLLRAGLAAGLDLPHECASGSCGACRCKLVEGAVKSMWAEAPGLSDRDRRRGNVVLMCQSRPQGDVTIDVNVRGELPTPRPIRTQAVVDRVRRLTTNMVELGLTLEDALCFAPGQFVIIDQPGCGRRAYSMSNTDACGTRLELIVKEKDGGALSGTLCNSLTSGDRITVEGPYGAAFLREDSQRPVVAIGGGSGLAPMWSIASRAAALGRNVALYFGINGEADRCFESEFADLADRYPKVRCHVIAVDPGLSGHRAGYVGDAVLEDLPDLTGADVYMAGPPQMIDAVMRRFVSEGRVDCDRVFYDRFA